LGEVPPLAAQPHEIAEGSVYGVQITLRHQLIMLLPTKMSISQVVAKQHQ
jgi:hypothetical protein